MNKVSTRIFIITICFSTIILLANLYYLIWAIATNDIGTNMNSFLSICLFTAVLAECIWILVTICLRKKVFSSLLCIQGNVLSITVLLASIIFPRISGYHVHYELLSWGKVTLIDGHLFALGLLLLSLGCIFRTGLKYENK